MKIVIYGAESTGKTSLAKALAAHYNTEWVPEYAREYLQEKYNQSGEVCAISDLIPIVKGQIELEKEAEKKVGLDGLIFCDTNPYQTYYYGKAYYQDFEYPDLWKLAQQRCYAYYFLTYIDTPWVADDLRDRPEERLMMHKLFKTSLEKNNFPYSTLEGSHKQRMAQAITKIDELIAINKKSI